MEYEKLTYINSRGETLEFGVGCLFHCNVSKDVTGLDSIDSTLYRTNSMGQHGDTAIGQRYEPRDIVIKGSINRTDKDRVLELRRQAERILNAELEASKVGSNSTMFQDEAKKIKQLAADTLNLTKDIKDKIHGIENATTHLIETGQNCMNKIKEGAEISLDLKNKFNVIIIKI